jgi:uncharacterized membrane protein YeaQ/YmgE (transglycosylase-associated protein family)
MTTLDLPGLRPLGIGEILDVSLKIVWRNAGTLIRVVVFVVFPVEILSALLQASAASSSSNRLKIDQTTGQISFSQSNLNAVIGATVAVFVLALLASTVASGACFRAIASAYLGEQTTWKDSLRFALGRSLSLLWITILVGVLSVLAAIACVLPGIYLWVGCSVAVPVLMTEGVKGRKALGRSRKLVSGFWWRTFGVTALGYLLSSILTGALSGVIIGFAASGTTSDSFAGIVLNIVAGTLGRVLTTPFVAAFVTVLYFDLRVRKEAFDLQLLAQRIGVEPPPDALARAGEPSPFEPDDQPPFWPPPPGWKPRGDR